LRPLDGAQNLLAMSLIERARVPSQGAGHDWRHLLIVTGQVALALLAMALLLAVTTLP
jgi:hypothetical protein